METPQAAPNGPQEPTTGDILTVRYRMPDDPDMDMVFANVIQTTYGGDVFMMTFGQLKPKSAASPEEVARVTSQEFEVRVVAQLAIPINAFIGQVHAINALLERLEKRGVLKLVEDEDKNDENADG